MTRADETLKSLILLNRLSLVGAKSVCGLLSGGTGPEEILFRIKTEDFLGKAEFLKKTFETFDAEAEIENCRRYGISHLSFLDEDYPQILKQITDPPLVLYMKGSILPEDAAAVAIVGTRHPSLYGRNQTRRFAAELAGQGMTIVSGLAQGIDQAAHAACLGIPYGRTIAVLGCGLDVNYPAKSEDLRRDIADHGAVISEYALGTPPLAENFPRRNRIISGLSQGVLVVEAHARSGSLITARMAMEQGRDVFAIPGPVDQLTSRGTNHLIKEGAALVEEPAEVMEALATSLIFQKREMPAVKPVIQPLATMQGGHESTFSEERGFSAEANSLCELLREKSLASEEIAQEGDWAPEQVAYLLTLLEMKGKVRKSPDGRFSVASF